MGMDAKQSRQIEALFFEMYNKLKAYAVSSLENESIGEEAVQEAFRIACQKPEALCSSPNPQGWLVNVLRNVVRNIRRSQTTAKRILTQYMSVQLEEHAVTRDAEDLCVLYGKIAQSKEFNILYDMAILGKSHEEMALERGITVVACRKRVQRAKEKLQKKIER